MLRVVCTLIFCITAASCLLNGTEATQGQFPFLVLLRVNPGDADGYICGGALVGSRYVLTSAHCSFGRHDEVVIGQNNIETVTPNNVIQVVNKVIPNNFGEHFDSNDICVMTLARDVTEVANITEFIPVATDELVIGDTATAVGYGQIAMNNLPQYANYKELQITDGDCNFSDFYAPYMYCVKNEGVQACFGDSGIPIVQYSSTLEKHVLVSIMSYGNANYCGKPGPAQTLAKLSVMIDFIEENIPSGNVEFTRTPSVVNPSRKTTTASPTPTPTARPTTRAPTTTATPDTTRAATTLAATTIALTSTALPTTAQPTETPTVDSTTVLLTTTTTTIAATTTAAPTSTAPVRSGEGNSQANSASTIIPTLLGVVLGIYLTIQ